MTTNFKLNISDKPAETGPSAEEVIKMIDDLMDQVEDEVREEEAQNRRDEIVYTVQVLTEAVAELSATAAILADLAQQIFDEA
jgi:hypothetical protein